MRAPSLPLALPLFASLLLSCGGGATSISDPPPPPTEGDEVASAVPSGRLATDVVPTRYALTLAIDPAREGFSGVAEIDVRLAERESAIFLHADGLEVSEVTVAAGDEEPRPAAWAIVDEATNIASITPAAPVGPGLVRVRVTYGAPYDASLEGLYRVEQAGHRYVVTQMEPLGARKAFPCFDEPGFKTPWDVTLVVPEAHAAIANALEVSSTPGTGGTRRVRFATTEPLPTYLVALAVGPFDVVEGAALPPNEIRATPIPFRAVAPHGEGARLAHALTHTPAILAALERYFGIPYPYPKLDLIAVPDFAFGAMENAGAITYRDSLLLLGESPPVSQQRGFAFITAHELAHQWFGNLVTMRWWDDLWLNEAFANWMEARIIQATFPAFAPELAEMDTVLSAMSADSLASARRIQQPIEGEHDIHNAFDSITYDKGNAVLAMFERWLGPEVFRRGVQRYLRTHAGGNARASDLFEALSSEAGRDVRAPFESFLTQAGLPLLDVEPSCADGAGSLRVRQSRYVPLGGTAASEARWQLPFCARVGRPAPRGAASTDETVCVLLTEQETQVPLEGGCAGWVMPNAGGTGYYRWSLPPEALAALGRDGLARLSVREAMAYADAIEASFAAGRLSFADALAALAPLAARPERQVAAAPMSLVSLAVDEVLTTDAERTAARAYGARLYRAAVARLGWTVRAGEDPETQLLRATVLGFQVEIARDPAARREALRRGRAYLGASGSALAPDAVPPDLAGIAVAVAVQEGGDEAFELALTRVDGTEDAIARGNLLRGVASVRDEARGARALALILGDRIRVNEVYRVLYGQGSAPETRARAFAWLREHYGAVAARLGSGLASYLPYVASDFCDAERAAEVRAFFAPHMAATQGGPRNLELAVESMTLCAARVTHARGTAPSAFAATGR